jgi:hypothetical protein
VAVGVSRWGIVRSTESGSWGWDWMRWGDEVLLGALYRAGRLAEAVEERSWWRPVEFNGAAVSSLEFALRGGETEGRCRYGRGSGGGAARDVEAASRQPTGQAVAARHRTGGGRRRRSGPSGLQRLGGPVLKMENENESGVGLDCKVRLRQIQIGPLRKIGNYFFFSKFVSRKWDSNQKF